MGHRLVATLSYKLECVVRMVVDSILPHAESEPKDHRKDAPPFILLHAENGPNDHRKNAPLFIRFKTILFSKFLFLNW